VVCTGASKDVRDVGTVSGGVSGKAKAKGGVSTGRLQFDVTFGGKGLESEAKSRDRDSIKFSRDRGIIVNSLEVSNIGREVSSSKVVIHAFIEAGMKGDLGSLGVKVVPENIFHGIPEETKEDAFARVVFELARAGAGRSKRAPLLLL
jgi:hypothetical protein